MKSKYLLLFLALFLCLPFANAFYTVDFSIPFSSDKYCELYSIQFTPDETSLNYDPSLTYVITNKDSTNSTLIYVNTTYNEFVNASNNVTIDNGFWDFIRFAYNKGMLPQTPSMNDWKAWIFGPGVVSGGTAAVNIGLEFLNQIRKVFSVKNDVVAYNSPLNATFSIGYGSTYQVFICQNQSCPTITGKCFYADVYFPEANYKPCDDKSLSHYFLVTSSSIIEAIVSFVSSLTEIWFILYWILKIGIIIAVVVGAIWLITYIYRLVRNALS